MNNMVLLFFPLVQWLRRHTSKAGGMRSTPSPRTRIPHAKWHGQKVKNKKTENPCESFESWAGITTTTEGLVPL